MADTYTKMTFPRVKMVDQGDGTYSIAVTPVAVAAGTDTTFRNVSPPLKAVDSGIDIDGVRAYLLSVVVT